MPPLTRSSAPSTPASQPVRASPDTDPTSPTPRRTPRCTKCHRPRAGHPRSGCPYVDPPARKPASPALQIAPTQGDGLSEELSSLHIVSPTEERARASNAPPTGKRLRRKLSVRFALLPEKTLASLSPTDTHLVEQLLQPAMVSDALSPQDKVAHVLKWRKTLDDAGPSVDDDHRAPEPEPAQESVDVKMEPPPFSYAAAVPPLSRRMPCTLSTPSASLTPTELVTDQGVGGSALDANETVHLPPSDAIPTAKKTTPLGRSMSFEQRSLFLQQLSHSSNMAPATLLCLSPADVDNVRAGAEKLGFHVRVLPSKKDGDRWVILGTEEEAIDLLAETFLEEEKKRGTRNEGRGGKLTAVAGGVVFGAVATWTGLAFS